MANLTLAIDDEGLYHIYNKAVGNDKLFVEEFHYLHFLEELQKYLLPLVEIWSVSLLPHYFQLLIELKKNIKGAEVSKAIGDLCNAYAKWLNAVTGRNGNLFNRPFRRNKICMDKDISAIICFIHNLPLLHGYVKKIDNWPYSSYNKIISETPWLASKKILNLFGGVNQYMAFHHKQLEDYFITTDQPVRYPHLTG